MILLPPRFCNNHRQTGCLHLIIFCYSLSFCHSLIASEPVSNLLSTHASTVQSLKDTAQSVLGSDALTTEPYCNDVFYLRYCCKGEPVDESIDLLKTNLAWRTSGEGKRICEAARQAVQQATSHQNKWDNEPVLQAAPHSSKIQQFLSPMNAMTTTSSSGDLLYIIRAGQIDDTSLMKAVTVDEMVEFFLYAKEVNAIVANQRSLQSDTLLSILTANDLQGVKLIGGSADFRQALSKSSKIANDLYPNMAGPTLLLNLPALLSALVKLFIPLFPAAVNERLKFAKLKLLAEMDRLTNVAPGGTLRNEFLKQVNDIVG